jgi:anti-sigma B factor antagonist
MKITQKKQDDVTICYIDGEINIDTVSALKAVFKQIIDNGVRKVLLNFDKVEYIDSLGIATLIEFAKSLSDFGGVMFLSNLSPNIRPIFGITKLERMFHIYDTEREALKHFRGY